MIMKYWQINIVLVSLVCLVCMGRPPAQSNEESPDPQSGYNPEGINTNEEQSESAEQPKASEDNDNQSDADSNSAETNESDESANTGGDVPEEPGNVEDSSAVNSAAESNTAQSGQEYDSSAEQQGANESDGEGNNSDGSVEESGTTDKPAAYESGVQAEIKPAVVTESPLQTTVGWPEASVTRDQPAISDVTDKAASTSTINVSEFGSSTVSGETEDAINKTSTIERIDSKIVNDTEQVKSTHEDPKPTMSNVNASNPTQVETVQSLVNQTEVTEITKSDDDADDETRLETVTESNLGQPSDAEPEAAERDALLAESQETTETPEIQTEAGTTVSVTFGLPHLPEIFNRPPSHWTDVDHTGEPDAEATVYDPCLMIQEIVERAMGVNLTKREIQNSLNTLRFLHEIDFDDLSNVTRMLTNCSETVLNKQQIAQSDCEDLKRLLFKICNQSSQCKGSENLLLDQAMKKVREILDTDQLHDVLLLARVCISDDFHSNQVTMY